MNVSFHVTDCDAVTLGLPSAALLDSSVDCRLELTLRFTDLSPSHRFALKTLATSMLTRSAVLRLLAAASGQLAPTVETETLLGAAQRIRDVVRAMDLDRFWACVNGAQEEEAATEPAPPEETPHHPLAEEPPEETPHHPLAEEPPEETSHHLAEEPPEETSHHLAEEPTEEMSADPEAAEFATVVVAPSAVQPNDEEVADYNEGEEEEAAGEIGSDDNSSVSSGGSFQIDRAGDRAEVERTIVLAEELESAQREHALDELERQRVKRDKRKLSKLRKRARKQQQQQQQPAPAAAVVVPPQPVREEGEEVSPPPPSAAASHAPLEEQPRPPSPPRPRPPSSRRRDWSPSPLPWRRRDRDWSPSPPPSRRRRYEYAPPPHSKYGDGGRYRYDIDDWRRRPSRW